MQPPNDLVRACLRWTVPAPTDMTDDPRRCVTNEADAIRGMPDLTKSDQRQVTRACVADSANGNRLIESREPAAAGGRERGVDPPANTLVVDVIAVEQCDEDIDVQQGARHTASSSRSRSTRALDTAGPRCSKGS